MSELDLRELDPRAPLFFLSYAHSGKGKAPRGQPQEPDQRFVKFFDDLSENVAELVSLPVGSDPGYMDQSMRSGVHWTRELLDAIGACQVFVPLLSARYFDSRWCGMEWYAFSQRKVVTHTTDKPDNQTAIVPVIWAPRRGRVPAKVDIVQRFSPSGLLDARITAQYERDGVVGLIRMRLDSDYHAVVWRLAQEIVAILYSHRVEPRSFKPGELRNMFREQDT